MIWIFEVCSVWRFLDGDCIWRIVEVREKFYGLSILEVVGMWGVFMNLGLNVELKVYVDYGKEFVFCNVYFF